MADQRVAVRKMHHTTVLQGVWCHLSDAALVLSIFPQHYCDEHYYSSGLATVCSISTRVSNHRCHSYKKRARLRLRPFPDGNDD